MNVFHCDHCQHLAFFENIQCVQCERALAYLPDVDDLGSLEPAGDDRWRSRAGAAYRLCKNYRDENVCNWAVPADDATPYCLACRLTRVIPDLSRPGHREAWYKVEVAKRRLVYSLRRLHLPLACKIDDPDCGLTFDFLADPDTPGAGVILTGHADGVVTLNLAEADDAERERRRLQLREPYRTLLGHFRHEVGHYYWDRLVRDGRWLEPFRALFGDEREDYAAALKRHYETGPPVDWQRRFVSAYASTHAWEDWAETWAHYLHITDTVETAAVCGMRLRPGRPDEPSLRLDPPLVVDSRPGVFDDIMSAWFPLTYVLNNLNRGMGLPDAYPFVLSPPAIEKLRFVHDVVTTARCGGERGTSVPR